MGDVEIVIKVPEGVPKEVVEKIIRRNILEVQEIRRFYGAIKPKKDVQKLIEDADNAWIE